MAEWQTMVKILVVDDEPDLEPLIRQGFRRRIRAGDYQFAFAGDQLIPAEVLYTSVDVIEFRGLDDNTGEVDVEFYLGLKKAIAASGSSTLPVVSQRCGALPPELVEPDIDVAFMTAHVELMG